MGVVLRLISVVLVATATGCFTTDPAFFDREGRPLADSPAVFYKVALAPIVVPAEGIAFEDPEGESELRFAYSAEAVQEKLVAALESFNAASMSVLVGDEALTEARQRRADLLVRCTIREPVVLGHVGVSENILPAVLLYPTWLGGLFVDDSTYEARVEASFDIINPHDGTLLDSFGASSYQTDLSFFDRASLFSWPGLQSLLIPSFWTTDEVEPANEALSQRICDRLAARLTRYLKEEIAATEREVLGELRLDSPANGQDVGPRAHLKGKIVAGAPIAEVMAYLNDAEVPVLDMSGSLPEPAEQRRGNSYQVFFDQQVDLAPGRNVLAIELSIEGRVTSRTLTLFNGPEEESLVGSH